MSESNRRLVAGSYSEMKTQMMILKQLQNEMIEMGGAEKELAPNRHGKILIKLLFFGKTTRGKKKAVRISFRLMKEQDSPKNITLEAVKQYGNLISSKFGNWQHITGKKLYSYCDWDKGYQLQLLVPNEQEAKRIVEQVLDIQSHSPEWEYLSLSQNAQEATRYPDLPNKETLGGRSFRPPQQRATATVSFTGAYIRFPKIPSSQKLCDRVSNLFTDFNFLEDD